MASQGWWPWFKSFFARKEPQTPIKSIVDRIKNIVRTHYRGLIGFFVPLCLLTWQGEYGQDNITVRCVWLWMAWSMLWQPVNVPVVGLIPVFILPMTGVMKTVDVCKNYFNDSIALFITGGMLCLLLNNTGADRRLILWILCCGSPTKMSPKGLVVKASAAAFILSMFSNRLIAVSHVLTLVTPTLVSLKSAEADKLRYIVNNAISTSSAIGSTGIIHASFATLFFRNIFYESTPSGQEYPDIFNYLQYSAFAIPVAIVCFVINCIYYIMLINWTIKKPIPERSMVEVKKALLKNKQQTIPKKITAHEIQSIVITVIYMAIFFLRWYTWASFGWSPPESVAPDIPVLDVPYSPDGTMSQVGSALIEYARCYGKGYADYLQFRKTATRSLRDRIKDSSVAATFLVLSHVLPKGISFTKYLKAKKKSQLPPRKPESAILYWRFVDRNTNYGYLYLLGAGPSIVKAAAASGLDAEIATNLGTTITNMPWIASTFVVVLIATVLCNIMTSCAAVTTFLPFVICMAATGAPDPWPGNLYLGALGVGIASSYGFMFPFLYTPAYYCHYVGKVPVKKMVKQTFVSCLICCVILWIALNFYAPVLWDPTGAGIALVAGPGGNDTSAAGGGAAAAPAAPDAAPPPPPGP